MHTAGRIGFRCRSLKFHLWHIEDALLGKRKRVALLLQCMLDFRKLRFEGDITRAQRGIAVSNNRGQQSEVPTPLHTGAWSLWWQEVFIGGDASLDFHSNQLFSKRMLVLHDRLFELPTSDYCLFLTEK